MITINFKENKPFMDWLKKQKPFYYSVVNGHAGFENSYFEKLIEDEFEIFVNEINAEVESKFATMKLLKELNINIYK
jgi:hypothetical protein